MKLIIGLGNPGKKYDMTRHNIGFMIIDEFIGKQSWSKNEWSLYYKTDINNEKAIFVKPTTYMNLSGNAVRFFVNYYKISINDILVIQDDLDLEIGSYKLKINSSSGGHNGIKSIIDSLGTNTFLRLKIGISKPENGDTVSYVLKIFSKNEYKKIQDKLLAINNLINDFIAGEEASSLMNKYNGNL